MSGQPRRSGGAGAAVACSSVFATVRAYRSASGCCAYGCARTGVSELMHDTIISPVWASGPLRQATMPPGMGRRPAMCSLCRWVVVPWLPVVMAAGGGTARGVWVNARRRLRSLSLHERWPSKGKHATCPPTSRGASRTPSKRALATYSLPTGSSTALLFRLPDYSAPYTLTVASLPRGFRHVAGSFSFRLSSFSIRTFSRLGKFRCGFHFQEADVLEVTAAGGAVRDRRVVARRPLPVHVHKRRPDR